MQGKTTSACRFHEVFQSEKKQYVDLKNAVYALILTELTEGKTSARILNSPRIGCKLTKSGYFSLNRRYSLLNSPESHGILILYKYSAARDDRVSINLAIRNFVACQLFVFPAIRLKYDKL